MLYFYKSIQIYFYGRMKFYKMKNVTIVMVQLTKIISTENLSIPNVL